MCWGAPLLVSPTTRVSGGSCAWKIMGINLALHTRDIYKKSISKFAGSIAMPIVVVKKNRYPTPTPLHMDCKMLACCPCNHNPGNSPHHRYVRPPGDACLISRSCLPCSRSTVGVALSASPLRRAYEYHVLKQSFWAEVG